MKLFRFDKEVGTHISHYESNFWLSGILRTENADIQISFMHLEEDGVIGSHAAKSEQLLLVIQGEGIVTGGPGQKKIKVRKVKRFSGKPENGMKRTRKMVCQLLQ